jgi:hypothetical protein
MLPFPENDHLLLQSARNRDRKNRGVISKRHPTSGTALVGYEVLVFVFRRLAALAPGEVRPVRLLHADFQLYKAYMNPGIAPVP